VWLWYVNCELRTLKTTELLFFLTSYVLFNLLISLVCYCSFGFALENWLNCFAGIIVWER